MQGAIHGSVRAELAYVERQGGRVRAGLLHKGSKGDVPVALKPGGERRGGLAAWAPFDSGEGDVGVAPAGLRGEAQGGAERVELRSELQEPGDPRVDLREDGAGGGGVGKGANAPGVHGGEGDL